MKFKLLLGRWKDYILTDPIRTSLFVFFTCLLSIAILTIFTTKHGYSVDFFENILVEAHGMLFDILVIGVLLYWMNKFGEKNREIARLQDELHYYSEYTEPEATFNVSKIIRQLNKLGVYNINLVRVYLADASMLGCQFNETKFIGNWLSRAFFHVGEFMNCHFVMSECISTNFTEAEFSICEFIECKLEVADFTDATLNYVKFKKCDMDSTSFVNTHLNNCSFSGSSLLNNDFENATLLKCDLTDYNTLSNSNFTGTTIQGCKLLKKDLDLYSKATLIDNEII